MHKIIIQISPDDSREILNFPTDHDGFEELPSASYRILLMNWMIYCFLVGSAFSGCILSFTNYRLHDAAVDTISSLEVALRTGSFAGGTMRETLTADMIDVSNPPCIVVSFGSRH